MATIDYSIDLGTTNSVIARFNDGEVSVFKNPMGLREVLPSVVAFKRDRILVGDKAREFLEKDPGNVMGLFKRKMGTTDTYYIESQEKSITPVELSSHVLKELKNFVPKNETLNDVVITIPASFDTVQSNATLRAGELAGFNSVTLLQEPVAASLAFVNKQKEGKDMSGYWIVYDLGGGTFDVALIKLDDGEMKVIDHAGDNFLGGTDFDQTIVDKLFVPALEKCGKFENLHKELKSFRGKHNKLYYKLLYKAEELKIQLSSMDVAELEFETIDDEGSVVDFYQEFSREQFEAVIAKEVQRTISFITNLLISNTMSFADVNSVLMIGGSTYIPLVRALIDKESGGKANYSVDPTTAVAVGAAYYAGSKLLKNEIAKDVQSAPSASAGNHYAIDINAAYQAQTQEDEEYFVARVDGKTADLFYRIIRADGGFDSGLKPLTEQLEEDLPLLPNSSNDFIFKVLDRENNSVVSNFSSFSIVQGKFGVNGQPLPADICLEVDDVEEKETTLEVIFEKNELLPLKRVIVKEVGTTITKGSKDAFMINILEGKQYSSPASNKPIGQIVISGDHLERDLIKNTDVEITVEMTESRELRVFTYLSMTGQEFENVFQANDRFVDIAKLKSEVEELLEKARMEKNSAQNTESYKSAHDLKQIEDSATELYMKCDDLVSDDVTDAKFQIEDQKRNLWYQLDHITSNKKLSSILKELHDARKSCEEIVDETGEEADKKRFQQLHDQEAGIIEAGNSSKIKNLSDQYQNLTHQLRWKQPSYVRFLFFYYANQPMEMYTNPKEAEKLIKKGEAASEADRIDELKVLLNMLYGYYRDSQENQEFSNRTGLV